MPLTGHRTRPIEPATLLHTLFSDFFSERDATTYVQTGDIPAMWLRDSSAQTIPYVRFAPAYPILAARFARVIERNARNVLRDPYANAFTASYGIWERKWEADSPAWPVLLAWVYWREVKSRILFTPAFHRALRATVDTFRCEQLHSQCSSYRPPFPVRSIDAFNPNTGMVWTAFRPSDDPVQYHFNIPQEAMVAVALRDVAALATIGYGDTNLANEANSMSAQVQTGIERYGTAYVPALHETTYVYETDGLGHSILVDDANIPNLTALPYLGWCSNEDPLYLSTRGYVLSSRNPYYYYGTYAQGLGSPHTPSDFVWPLGIIGRALTATSSAEIAESITTLAETDSRDGLIHESFYAGGYWEYTRAEFGWANALYAELIFRTLAGFRSTPFPAYGWSMTPLEPVSGTPALTPPLAQLRNAALIYNALTQRLAQADGRER